MGTAELDFEVTPEREFDWVARILPTRAVGELDFGEPFMVTGY